MDKNHFSILEAVRDAYLFVGREWLYLLKAGALPVAVHIVAALFIQFERPDASLIEGYLWSLPAATLFAWFVFVEMRLLLLGERITQLPQTHDDRRDRQHAMKLSVITALLFNMVTAALMALLVTAANPEQWGINMPLTVGGLLAIGALFWGLRFGIVPILAAVQYPIRPVLRQVLSGSMENVMFSFRLLGMGLVCLFPVAIMFQVLITLFVHQGDTPATQLNAMQQLIMIIATAPLSLLISALLNAAAAHALKQMLGPQ